MKKHITNIILIMVLLVGLGLLLYPSFSDYWNTRSQSRAIDGYVEQVDTLDEKAYEKMWQDALDYNASLLNRPVFFTLNEEQTMEYNALLNVDESGIMGYIEIPEIDCRIPLYHGTSEGVLQTAVGHLEWTSLPVGGESSHCAFSGHRGLPSARLFTDLDKMMVGDVFMLYILDKVLTYEVDQIRIVEPHETDDLLIVEGEDYCTLVTCTPYGVNSHRLLVRGHRIENIEETGVVRITADAVRIDPLVVAPVVALPMLLILLIVWLPKGSGAQKKKNGGDTNALPK